MLFSPIFVCIFPKTTSVFIIPQIATYKTLFNLWQFRYKIIIVTKTEGNVMELIIIAVITNIDDLLIAFGHRLHTQQVQLG